MNFPSTKNKLSVHLITPLAPRKANQFQKSLSLHEFQGCTAPKSSVRLPWRRLDGLMGISVGVDKTKTMGLFRPAAQEISVPCLKSSGHSHGRVDYAGHQANRLLRSSSCS